MNVLIESSTSWSAIAKDCQFKYLVWMQWLLLRRTVSSIMDYYTVKIFRAFIYSTVLYSSRCQSKYSRVSLYWNYQRSFEQISKRGIDSLALRAHRYDNRSLRNGRRIRSDWCRPSWTCCELVSQNGQRLSYPATNTVDVGCYFGLAKKSAKSAVFESMHAVVSKFVRRERKNAGGNYSEANGELETDQSTIRPKSIFLF